MNTNIGEATSLARELRDRIGETTSVEVVICPPFTNLSAVRDVVTGSSLILGGQDMFWEAKGAFTGEISASMLLSVGASYVIVGHSERRHILNESSEIVNRKAKAALAAEMRII